MKEIWFFLFVSSIMGLLIGVAEGFGFMFGAPLASLPVQESAALFIFGSGLIVLAGYGKRKQQKVLARHSKEDRIC